MNFAALSFKQWMEIPGIVIDGFGVLVILIGVVIATVRYMQNLNGGYVAYRQNLAKAILLGLEILIAGDIIRTVAVDPTMGNAAVLGVIVLIRTFLSTTLQLEVEGRFPWQKKSE